MPVDALPTLGMIVVAVVVGLQVVLLAWFLRAFAREVLAERERQ